MVFHELQVSCGGQEGGAQRELCAAGSTNTKEDALTLCTFILCSSPTRACIKEATAHAPPTHVLGARPKEHMMRGRSSHTTLTAQPQLPKP